jgi:prevent-host-death family protein
MLVDVLGEVGIGTDEDGDGRRRRRVLRDGQTDALAYDVGLTAADLYWVNLVRLRRMVHLVHEEEVMADMTTTEVRKNFGAVLDRVAAKERIVMRRHGRIIGAVVPAEDYAFLESVRSDQERFWGEDWRERERAVDAEYAAGQAMTYANGEEFLRTLRAIDAEAAGA